MYTLERESERSRLSSGGISLEVGGRRICPNSETGGVEAVVRPLSEGKDEGEGEAEGAEVELEGWGGGASVGFDFRIDS